MDPKHRDRIAFVRVCSGKFERDMTVHPLAHGEEGPPVQFAQAVRQRARDGRRGVSRRRHRPGRPLRLRHRRHADRRPGHSLQRDPALHAGSASPSCTIRTRPSSSSSAQGLDQLLQEGVIQALYLRNSVDQSAAAGGRRPAASSRSCSIRLESEYGAESRLEPAPWTVVRWLPQDIKEAGSGRPLLAHRRADRLRHGPAPGRALRERMVGQLLRADQPESGPLGLAR